MDEAGTLAALKSDCKELIEPSVAEHKGRIVKLMGDGLLIEFPSAIEAVRCAVKIQQALAGRDAGAFGAERTAYRIGVNFGDIVVEDEDIYGDGVNIAARLERLAEPGGICISDKVYEEVRGRIDLDFADMGEREVRNIDRPLRVWQWTADAAATATPRQARPSLPAVPDKPSIAVLPFDNMSDDPEQDYFADGITEDIITGLARFHALFVIARNSTFVYKGRSVNVQDIGRDLGVRYLVEGSVRKAGQKVRVNAQLIESSTGQHVWAERYDRNLDDIFAVQDEITQAIVSTLPGRLEEPGRELVRRKPTASMSAYDHVLLGLELFKRFSREGNLEARKMFQAAIDHDPRYARAHAFLASTYVFDLFIYDESDQSLDKAYESAETALALDDTDGWPHLMLGYALFLRGQDDETEIHFRRAISLNPNDADGIAFMANTLVYLGRWEEGLDYIAKAMRINPYPPVYYHWYHGLGLYSAREYGQAVAAIKQIRLLDRWHHALLAMCYAQLDKPDEAAAEIARFAEARRAEIAERGVSGQISDLDLVSERVSKYRVKADRDHFLEGLRKAGLKL